MAISTIYDVRVRLMMSDKGSKALLGTLRQLRNIKVEMAGIRQQSSGMGLSLGKLAATAGGAFGFMKAKESLIDFNAGLEQSRINVAGMLSQATGQEFGKSMVEATALVGRLQMRARDSIGTTQDMVEMAAMITRPIKAAGMGMKDLEDFTASAVVAAKAFNISPDMAALDIETALMGDLKSKDRFSRALLESKAFGNDYVGEKGRQRFNAMSPEDRASTYRKALTTGGIADMAKAQGQTFSGVYSTLQDNLQLALGKIGLPLFQAITNEIKQWNAWLDANGPKIAEFSQKMSHGLIEGFKLAKDAGAFLVRHKDLLITLAKAWLAGKAVKGMAGMFVDAGAMVKGLTEGAAGGLAGLATKANVAANALGLIAGAAVALADWIDTAQEERIDKDVARSSFGGLIDRTHMGTLSPRYLYDEAKRMGYLGEGGKGLGGANPLQFGADKSGWITGEKDGIATSLPFEYVAALLERGRMESEQFAIGKLQELMLGLNKTLIGVVNADPSKQGKTKRSNDINVHIRNVEVATDDPDRFVVGLANLAEDAIKNPSAARGSIRY